MEFIWYTCSIISNIYLFVCLSVCFFGLYVETVTGKLENFCKIVLKVRGKIFALKSKILSFIFLSLSPSLFLPYVVKLLQVRTWKFVETMLMLREKIFDFKNTKFSLSLLLSLSLHYALKLVKLKAWKFCE